MARLPGILLAAVVALSACGQGSSDIGSGGPSTQSPSGQPPSDPPPNRIELLRRPLPVVATQRLDNGRSGVNQREYVLTPSALTSGEFQWLYDLPVDGQVYAQPLYLPQVPFPDASVRNLLIVATMENRVYVFDVDGPLKGLGGAPLASIDLGAPVAFDFIPMAHSQGRLDPCPWTTPSTAASADPVTGNPYNIFPLIGITSTPVIDTSTMTLFVTNKTVVADGSVHYNLHALRLLPTLARRSGSASVEITATLPATGAGSVGGLLAFDPSIHLQRSALVLEGGKLYVAFGSHQDTSPFHGWLFEYDPATLAQTAAFVTNPMSSGAAIWQAGNGPVGDGKGSIFVMTGNREDRGCGSAGTAIPPLEHEQSFLKFGPGLSLLGAFRHPNAARLNEEDLDLGSSGPVLIPGTSLLAGAGKDATMFLFDASTMQLLGTTVINTKLAGRPRVRGNPVAWRDSPTTARVFVWPENDQLKAFLVRTDTATPGPPVAVDSSALEAASRGMPAGLLSLSVNGAEPGTGVLWASLPIEGTAAKDLSRGVLRAFSATNLQSELWNSERNAAHDAVGLFAKNAPPVVANGRVFLATFSDKIRVYGMRQWASVVATSDESRNVPRGARYGPLVTLENTGMRTWRSADGDALRVTFSDPASGTVVSTSTIPLPRDVSVGELVQMDTKVPVPNVPGVYLFDQTLGTNAFGATGSPFGEHLVRWVVTVQ